VILSLYAGRTGIAGADYLVVGGPPGVSELKSSSERGTTKETLASFIDASGTNKPSSPNSAISGSD
jgi:hypothetical protein